MPRFVRTSYRRNLYKRTILYVEELIIFFIQVFLLLSY